MKRVAVNGGISVHRSLGVGGYDFWGPRACPWGSILGSDNFNKVRIYPSCLSREKDRLPQIIRTGERLNPPAFIKGVLAEFGEHFFTPLESPAACPVGAVPIERPSF